MASHFEVSDTEGNTSPVETPAPAASSVAKTSKSKKKRLLWRLRCRGRITADYEVSEHFPDSESDVDNSVMAPPTSNTNSTSGSHRTTTKDRYLLIAARSDGKLQIPIKNKSTMLDNCPTSQQLNQNRPPDTKGYRDYFREILPNDPRHLNWRTKLGFLIAEKYPENTQGPPESYCFAAFPDNYRLYEHVRIKAHDGTKSRSDFYLYGHPDGPSKRFRSPKDFFPHLELIMFDGLEDNAPDNILNSGPINYMNCTCVLCCPPALQKEANELFGEPGSAQEAQMIAGTASSVSIGPKVVIPRMVSQESLKASGTQANNSRKVPAPKPVQKSRSNSTTSNMTVPRAPQTSALALGHMTAALPASNLQINTSARGRPLDPALYLGNQRTHNTNDGPLSAATALALPQLYEQDLDSQYKKYIYRQGEVVWHEKGQAWGIAVVVNRELFKDQQHQDQAKYALQPLSHPYDNMRGLVVHLEHELRPWLAWSPPPLTHGALAEQRGVAYGHIDWAAVAQGHLGPGDIEVDASILASYTVDTSFTPVEPYANRSAYPGEQFYYGIYIGCEKIWIGECIRLRTGNITNTVMVLHNIIEKQVNGNAANANTITLIGDVYKSHIRQTGAQPPVVNPNLPTRFQKDLDFRNQATIDAKGQYTVWKLVQTKANVGLHEVKGRWYESSILLPILEGKASFAQAAADGDIGDVGTYLNGRGEGIFMSGKEGTKFMTRIDAMGRSVPPHTRISKGLDGEPGISSFPMPTVGGGVGGPSGTNNAPGTGEDIGDFLDLSSLV